MHGSQWLSDKREEWVNKKKQSQKNVERDDWKKLIERSEQLYLEGQWEKPIEQLKGHRTRTKVENWLYKEKKIKLAIRCLNYLIWKGMIQMVKSRAIPAEKAETNTGRGLPHIYIALLAEGRPRITGLKIAINHVRIIIKCFQDTKKDLFLRERRPHFCS